MLGKLSILGGVIVLALGLVAAAGITHAQYPEPGDTVTATSESLTVPTGGTTEITCEVDEADGSPASLAPCTFSIISEPGGPTGDAAIGSKVVTKVTNAQGIASADLYVGTTPGVEIIEVSSGDAVSTILITVVGEAASPPQSPVGNIQPPSTGSGGLAH